MAPALVDVPLDLTGTSQGNLVIGEEHTLPTRAVRYLAPNLGGFFADTVEVIDTVTGLPLRPDQGYPTERLEMPTVKARQDVCLIFAIVDPTVSEKLIVNYHAVGGIFARPGTSVVEQLLKIESADRPANWPGIMRKKSEWSAHELEYDVQGREGFETTALVLQRIDEMITNGDEVSHDKLRTYVLDEITRLGGNTSLAMQNVLTGHNAKPDPHSQYMRLADLGSAIDAVRTPTIVAPPDGSLDGTHASLTFTGGPYRALYEMPQKALQLQVSLTNSFDGQLAVDRTVEQAVVTTTVTTGLIPNQRYYWRMRYQNLEGEWSHWTPVATFVTKNLYAAKPTITSPAQGAIVAQDDPTITGSAFAAVGTVDTHASSDWEIWTGPNGTGTRVFASINNTANKTSIRVTPGLLSVSTTYYLRVRYTGASVGMSEWSDEVVVTTTSTFIPTVLGVPYGGGSYGGRITYGGKTYAIVVAPKASGEKSQTLMTSDVATTGAYSDTDSVANTLALLTGGVAAPWARALTIGGYNDWQVPAREVLNILANNLLPSNSASPANFRTGGAEAFSESVAYWSSTARDWTRDDSYTTGGDPIYGQQENTTWQFANYIDAMVVSKYSDNPNDFPLAAYDACGTRADWPADKYQNMNAEQGRTPTRNPYPQLATGGTWSDGSKPDPPYRREDMGANFPYGRYSLTTHYRCDFGQYFQTHTYYTQIIIGYTPVVNHPVFTDLKEGYTQSFAAAKTAVSVSKSLTRNTRAVRLIDIASIT